MRFDNFFLRSVQEFRQGLLEAATLYQSCLVPPIQIVNHYLQSEHHEKEVKGTHIWDTQSGKSQPHMDSGISELSDLFWAPLMSLVTDMDYNVDVNTLEYLLSAATKPQQQKQVKLVCYIVGRSLSGNHITSLSRLARHMADLDEGRVALMILMVAHRTRDVAIEEEQMTPFERASAQSSYFSDLCLELSTVHSSYAVVKKKSECYTATVHSEDPSEHEHDSQFHTDRLSEYGSKADPADPTSPVTSNEWNRRRRDRASTISSFSVLNDQDNDVDEAKGKRASVASTVYSSATSFTSCNQVVFSANRMGQSSFGKVPCRPRFYFLHAVTWTELLAMAEVIEEKYQGALRRPRRHRSGNHLASLSGKFSFKANSSALLVPSVKALRQALCENLYFPSYEYTRIVVNSQWADDYRPNLIEMKTIQDNYEKVSKAYFEQQIKLFVCGVYTDCLFECEVNVADVEHGDREQSADKNGETAEAAQDSTSSFTFSSSCPIS